MGYGPWDHKSWSRRVGCDLGTKQQHDTLSMLKSVIFMVLSFLYDP